MFLNRLLQHQPTRRVPFDEHQHFYHYVVQVAVDQHCPVLDLFSNPTSVRTELVAG